MNHTCPKCRDRVIAAETRAGPVLDCPYCGQPLSVSAVSEDTLTSKPKQRLSVSSTPEGEPIREQERSGWKLVQQGLLLEEMAVGILLILVGLVNLCTLWILSYITYLDTPNLQNFGFYSLETVLIVGTILLWLLLVCAGRFMSAVASPPSSRLATLGCAALFAVVAVAFAFYNVFAASHVRALLPRSLGSLLLIAGILSAELLFLLRLRAVALRFGEIRLAQSVIAYFPIAVLIPAAVYLLTLLVRAVFAGANWLPRFMELQFGFVSWALFPILVWRLKLIRQTRACVLRALRGGPFPDRQK